MIGNSAQRPTASLDRFRGLMLGTAIGDGLGRPVEGHRCVADSYISEVLSSPPPLINTDDTIMTIGLATSLLESTGFSRSDMAIRFASDYQNDPNRGYGLRVVEVFEDVLRGVPWDQAARRQFGGQGSYGNGAAMRVAPVALWAYPNIDLAVRLAEETASVTHTHPVGIEGAVIQVVAACHALACEPSAPFDTDLLLADLRNRVHTDEFRAKLEILPSCLERDDEERIRLHLGNWVGADKSVVTALYCFLLSTDFEDAMVRALRIGGDTDTIAAMTGALAGARYGLANIPRQWRQVETADVLLSLADGLYDHAFHRADPFL